MSQKIHTEARSPTLDSNLKRIQQIYIEAEANNSRRLCDVNYQQQISST